MMSEAKQVVTEQEVETTESRLQAVEEAIFQTEGEAKRNLKPGVSPLIKGFRDEAVILPLAVLQKRVEEGFETISNGFQVVQRNNMQSFNYILQIVGGAQSSIAETRRTVAAVIS